MRSQGRRRNTRGKPGHRLGFAHSHFGRVQPTLGYPRSLLIQKTSESLQFLRLRQSAQHLSEREGNPLVIRLAALIDRLPGQSPGCLNKLRFIERSERLQRCIGAKSTHAGHIPIGCVERLQHRIRNAAEAERVERTPIAIWTGFHPPSLGSIARRRLEQKLRSRRINRPPTEGGIDQPGHRQSDVPNDLTLHTKPRASRQQPVVGIPLQQDRTHTTGLAVRRRAHNEPVQVLDGPRSHSGLRGLHKLNRQPIEQFPIRCRGRLHPEVFNALHQSDPKILLPEAIDGHACGRGRAGIHQPASECEAGIISTGGQRMQECWRPMSDFTIRLQPVPAPEQSGGHAAFSRPLPLSRREHQRRSSLRPLLPQRLNPCVYLGKVCLSGPPIREHRSRLSRRPPLRRGLHHDRAHGCRQWIRHSVGGRRNRKTEPP